MRKYIAFLLTVLAVSLTAVSCNNDSDDDDDTQARYRANKEAGESFLLANRDSDGVVETYTGLQYRVDTVGDGITPTLEDSVTITYTGSLVDGTVFTSATTTMAMEDEIAGMQEGLLMMNEGSVYDLYIPYYLAYKAQSQNLMYNNKVVSLLAYSMLHFHVRLDSVIHYTDVEE